MSIVQISRIQHRSGLYENLPQLAKAEMGWAVDQRRLYIGNGTLNDGAPETGNTEILTEYSDILNLANNYNFKNSDAGYNPQTGNAKAEYTAIAYDGNTYVAVGSSGKILTSTDAITWSNVTSGTTSNLKSIAYGGGLFVAVGANATVIYSTNGTVWQTGGAVAYTTINSITYGNGKFVIVTLLGSIYTSTNGTTWTLQTSGVTTALNTVTYAASKYVAGGSSGKILTSSDAITWTSQTISNFDILSVNYLTTSSSAFVATAAGNKAFYSPDGVTWYRSFVDSFTAATTDGTNSYAITSWGAVYKNTANTLNYLALVDSSLEDCTNIYHNGAGLFTVLTGSGKIYTSSNASSWTQRTSGVTTGLNKVYYDGTYWVVVGDGGVILTSTNGTTFTSQTSGTTNNLYGITKITGGNWIAVGQGGKIITATTPTSTWTTQVSGITTDLNDVTFADLGGGTYKAIAVGNSGIGLTSPTGVAWTLALNNSATNPSGATVSVGNIRKVIYTTFTPPSASPTSRYIIVGDHGLVATSANSTTWNTTTTYTFSDFNGITYDGSYFFVAGDVGLTYLYGQDAASWSAISKSYGTNLLSPDLYDSGTNGTLSILGAQYGYLYTATNQYKFWRSSTANLNNTIDNIIYTTKFVVVGANGLLSYSSDGVTWTSQSYSYGNNTTTRSIQQKLDDFVSVKDFGAKGDGVSDDTESINRALYELYCRTSALAAHKVLYFPAGNYKVSGSINVPSNARLRGEGTYNTQITQTANPYVYPYVTWVMYTADNKQQIQNLIGLNGANLPTDITISDMTLESLNDGIIVDTASRVTLDNIRFQGPNSTTVTVLTDPVNGSTTAGLKLLGRSLVYSTDVNVRDCLFNGFHTGIYLPANQYMSNTLIDSCSFYNLYHGIYFTGSSAIGVTVTNSVMDLIYDNGVNVDYATNFVSIANYYKDVGNKSSGISNPFYNIIKFGSNASGAASIGDNFDRTYATSNSVGGYPYVSETADSVEWDYAHGLRLGSIAYKKGNSLTLANNTTAVLVTNLDDYGSTFGLEFQYTITRNSQVASGIAKFTLTSTGLYSIEDDRTQSGDVGVTFGYNGSTDITYTTDANGTGLINYAIRYFEML